MFVKLNKLQLAKTIDRLLSIYVVGTLCYTLIFSNMHGLCSLAVCSLIAMKSNSVKNMPIFAVIVESIYCCVCICCRNVLPSFVKLCSY